MLAQKVAVGYARISASRPDAIVRLHHHFHVQIVVSSVSPEVFGTWQALSEETQQSQHGVRRNVFVHPLELELVDPLPAFEADVEDLAHFVHGLHSLLEVVEATALLRELSFDTHRGCARGEIDDWQTAHDRGNVVLGNEAIPVEIVHLENQLDLLVEARAVESEQAGEEFSLVQIGIVVDVHHVEEPFAQNSWQLGVIEEGHFVDAFGGVVGPHLQIFENILEVGQANLGFEVLVGLQFHEFEFGIS